MTSREPVIDRVIKCLEIARKYGPSIDAGDGMICFSGPFTLPDDRVTLLNSDTDTGALLRLGAFVDYTHGDRDAWAIFT